MTLALKVENLGKKYLIRHQKTEGYTSLREVLMQQSKQKLNSLNPFAKGLTEKSTNMEEFWALKNLNFEIKQGDKVGIIGRNGAGKSTLLKLLSRITEPSTGRISINGKIASLLEVGTGFHPELTGRENIFLNGAILGMSHSDIKKQFNNIVAFAEVEKFLDTPVKRYSSGMYVRLAFAVAAHIETEILVVDEVLAVGDAKFQKKSLQKMDDISKSGRTLLFVSHNMGAISELCDNTIVLNEGNVDFIGNVETGIEHYLNFSKEQKKLDVSRYKRQELQIHAVYLMHDNAKQDVLFDIDENITICVEYEMFETLHEVRMDVILSRFGIDLFYSFNTDDTQNSYVTMQKGKHKTRITMMRKFLKAGRYSAKISIGTASEILIYVYDINFDVEEISINTKNKGYKQDRSGLVIAQCMWHDDY